MECQNLFGSFELMSFCCGGNGRGVELERTGRVWGRLSGVLGALTPRVPPRICRINKWCISQGGALTMHGVLSIPEMVASYSAFI